jgi:hypothetical protein
MENRTIADLLNEIRAGNTYVNVHTDAFPEGEIRGQLMLRMPEPNEPNEIEDVNEMD